MTERRVSRSFTGIEAMARDGLCGSLAPTMCAYAAADDEDDDEEEKEDALAAAAAAAAAAADDDWNALARSKMRLAVPLRTALRHRKRTKRGKWCERHRKQEKVSRKMTVKGDAAQTRENINTHGDTDNRT